MKTDLQKKRVIMIHGLAPKPPKNDLHEFWKRCLIENLRLEDAALATELEGVADDCFRSAYWANATPHHIEDDADYVIALRKRVKSVIEARIAAGEEFHVGKGAKIKDFFKDRGEDLVKIVSGALTVKDDVMKGFLNEIKLYDEDQYIADLMRKGLEDELRAAWDDGCEVALLSHSMGSFIAYDVLWRFSHRSTDGFREYNDKRVQIFATMGSPLGEGAVRDLLFAAHHKNTNARHFPGNIDFWHNYSCLGDVVSHPSSLDDDFFKPMRKLGLFPKKPKFRAIDYDNLHNPFVVVTNPGNKRKEKRNPHKSYGYLVQPRLGSWLKDFLHSDLDAAVVP
jgi:hypothetical protein